MARVKAPGKWIEAVQAEMPLAEAAGQVLHVRLEAVERMLPPAVRRSGEDEEYVHQLRVATRRAGAALDIFAECLKPSAVRRCRRALKRLRRAAALARECDVQRGILVGDRTVLDAEAGGALQEVIDRLDKQRRQAQKSIRKAARRYPVKKLRRRRRKLLRSLRAGGDAGAAPRLADAARDGVPPLLAQMRAAASADLSVPERLHELRIAGKRLRYALEVFAPCFGEDFEETYGRVEALQERLGDINDSHDLVTRTAPFGIDLYRRRLREQTRAFLSDWEAGGRGRLFEALRRLTPDARGHGAAAVEIETLPAAVHAGGPAGEGPA